MTTLTVQQYEEAALLRAKRFRFEEARFDPATNRVALLFDDPTGEAQGLLKDHRAGNATVSTLDFEEALKWAKTQIFQVRRRRSG